MTLDTRIYIHSHDTATTVQEVFRQLQCILQRWDEDGRGPDQQKWHDGPDRRFDSATREFVEVEATPGVGCKIENEIGQGLPAWMWVSYRLGRDYRTEDEVAAHDEDCNLPENECFDEDEPVCDGTGWTHNPDQCWAEVMLDTAYGYHGPNGIGCSVLHAAIMVELGAWLTERGITWSWRNEFTGDVHEGLNGIEGFLSGGDAALDWFQNLALPAIQAHVALEGGRLELEG